MLPPDMSKNLDDWLLVEYETRNKILNNQLRQIQNQLAAKGLGHSGTLVTTVINVLAQELTIRAQITFQQFLKSADDCALTIDDSFRAYGRSEIDRRIRFILLPELRAKTSSVPGLKNIGTPLDSALSEIDMASDRAVRKYQAELDSMIMRNKTQRRPPNLMHGATFNVSGTVGVIQIGSGNSATTIQQIEQSTITSLNEVLGALIPEIEALSDAALPTPKKELVDVVIASTNELRKNHPNWTLLRSLLSGVAGTIQTIAALQPTYETLKGLLALVGINCS